MSKNSIIDISVIIVNYYSLKEINECINSILGSQPSKLSIEIIIVSNSPEDEKMINQLKTLSGNISYLQSKGNLGFAKANNIGASQAKGEYLFILNPDTKMLNNAIELLYDKAKKNTSLGIIAPGMYTKHNEAYPSVTSDINATSLLSLALPFGDLFFSKKNTHKYFLPDESCKVDVVQGSAMFISSALYQAVGGMSEDFFMYSEERDLCLKVRKKGFSVFYYKVAKVQHIGGATTSSNFLRMEVEKHRSKKKFLSKYYPNLVLLNRFCGLVGYSWRTLIALLSFQKRKTKQFGTLLRWYLFIYH